ncbi:ParB-like protein [Sinorhizobium sp. RAC02]|uniref:ParB-like protein n=1 Tax=Sinorhizobium sp. RAC02 TaxID=1842534 RepID=UPI00336BC98A
MRSIHTAVLAAIAATSYRLFAGCLRNTGGYAKDPTPHSEFIWSEFCRCPGCRRRLSEGAS